MKTSIEIAIQPMNAIEVVSQSPPAIEIHSSKSATTLEVSLATIGPKGETGAPGQLVGVEEFIGDPNANFTQLYQIYKL